tara:strand:- start:719 stop:1231 length:513 start_codon:yes stop_codon:yes gene_type:complete
MFKEIKNFCYLKHIKESKIIKNKLLKYMEDMPLNTYEEVSKTDWGLSSDYKRPYVKYFINILKPYMQKIVKKLNTKNWLMHNMWFQQYNKNSHHTWHTHPSVQFSSVYYLELPDTNVSTEFKDIVNNNIFKVDVKEGDLLVFPSSLLHRSPKNKSNKRKSVISFNSSFLQ